MWPFTKSKEETNDTPLTSMLDRWIDLEARVTRLEMAEKIYRSANRRKITAESEDLKPNGGIISLPPNGLNRQF